MQICRHSAAQKSSSLSGKHQSEVHIQSSYCIFNQLYQSLFLSLSFSSYKEKQEIARTFSHKFSSLVEIQHYLSRYVSTHLWILDVWITAFQIIHSIPPNSLLQPSRSCRASQALRNHVLTVLPGILPFRSLPIPALLKFYNSFKNS